MNKGKKRKKEIQEKLDEEKKRKMLELEEAEKIIAEFKKKAGELDKSLEQDR